MLAIIRSMLKASIPWTALALLAAAARIANAADPEAPRGYYRYPALHGDTIVFTSEGDLWRVGVAGGVAQRLTTHAGTESHAAISPDGLTLAFVGEYEGAREVYTMPISGGLPTRRTFRGNNSRVVGWTPSGRILIATDAFSTLPNVQLLAHDPATGAEDLVPLAQASQGCYDSDGRVLYFTRLTKQSSSTKRYQGGWVENLWRFEGTNVEATPLTSSFPGTSRSPMWWQGRLYHVSDRDGIMNLWSIKPDGADPVQHTRHRDYDIKSPSLQGGRIVYQQGPDLRLYDIAKSTDATVDIRLASDLDQNRERWVHKPMDYLTSVHLSPNGDRIVLTARGQVFVAPVEQGRFLEIPRTTGVRMRNARFLPDGKSLEMLTDATGEYEFWRYPANGSGAPEAWTTQGKVFRFEGVPSPDGKKLVWSDKDRKFWILDIPSKAVSLITDAPHGDVNSPAWSPDSQWLAYVMPATNQVYQLHLFRPSDGKRVVATSDRVDSFSPAWSPDGKWLYFLSDRDLKSLVDSPWGPRQPEPFFTDTTRIFALALTADAQWPFAPKTELQPDKPDEKKDKETVEKAPEKAAGDVAKTEKGGDKPPVAGEKKAETPPAVNIELDGLAARLHEAPVPSGNYQSLEATAKHLLWIARDTGFNSKRQLKQLEITAKDPKPKTLVEDVRSHELSGDGKKLLVRKGDQFYVIAPDAAAPAKLEDAVSLDGWKFAVAPREEWEQIFAESWRMMRDHFYDRGLHQLDWEKTRAKYAPFVRRVNDRGELSDAISEMVGELSTLHIMVAYGDAREIPDRIPVASLGARWTRDEKAGGWRVQHVYRADPDYPSHLAPLAKIDSLVREGEVITTINGRPTLGASDAQALLRNTVGKQVLLEVKSQDGSKTRQVIARPMDDDKESDLRYDEWELTRREIVETLGQGQIGYVHLRAMGAADIEQWARMYFPVFQRQGLIVDVRNNHGGNIDAWILEKLLRKAWFFWQPRVGDPTWNMHYAFRGHMTVLCNEKTASDGEAFTEGFKRLGLGKVIGTRTWGGEIWLSAQRWLVDHGFATAAEFGVYGPEGAWLIEGHGVDPDIVVDNLPHATFRGEDAQLSAAVKHLQELIRQDPRPIPAAPRYPDKRLP
ncbi:MAG: PD40 domain-containing protein [Verrucomicrobia bacterium]|nr:PD40 domain-containing protein [Verrucomicrobiota bacterium]MBI3869258.1 PD40 domain-containing protein [Verrucomicrobiota bacterium]